MHFFKSILIGVAAVVAVVIAQSSSGHIGFTRTPVSVTPGQKFTLEWDGGDASQPVTINLRRGNSNDLTTVRLITGSATGKSYTWTIPADLPSASDYTLEINQGVDDSNYSGRFALSGGTSSSASSASSASTTTTSSVTSASAILQSALATVNSTSVTTTVAASNATTTVGSAFGSGAMGTGVAGSGASGMATGTALHRNTTMSKPTLKGTTSSTAASSTDATTTTTGSGSTGTGTGSGSKAPPTSGAMDFASFASPLALILSAVAAIVYLA